MHDGTGQDKEKKYGKVRMYFGHRDTLRNSTSRCFCDMRVSSGDLIVESKGVFIHVSLVHVWNY